MRCLCVRGDAQVLQFLDGLRLSPVGSIFSARQETSQIGFPQRHLYESLTQKVRVHHWIYVHKGLILDYVMVYS